ncbi:unnamed protein product [Peronospora effusa]|nr:unnamed protein product [Peronospora effusa]
MKIPINPIMEKFDEARVAVSIKKYEKLLPQKSGSDDDEWLNYKQIFRFIHEVMQHHENAKPEKGIVKIQTRKNLRLNCKIGG